jgi:hypothetical protein
MNKSIISAVASLWVAVAAVQVSAAGGAEGATGGRDPSKTPRTATSGKPLPKPGLGTPLLTATFEPTTKTVTLSSAEMGVILDHLCLDAGRQAEGQANQQISAGTEGSSVVVRAGERPIWRVDVQGLQVTVRPEANAGDAAGLTVTARWRLDPGAMPAILKSQAGADGKVVVTRLGPAQVPTAGALFDRGRDFALAAGPAGKVRWTRGKDGWQLSAAVSAKQPLTLSAFPHYYRDTLGIAFYTPFKKPSRWPAAPVLCMTWYGTHDQRLSNLKPHIDWAAEHLLPYATSSFVFQLDDAYAQRDDRAMRETSDYIRAKGMLPGIWLAPFRVVPKSEAAHREWFLHGRDGKPLDSFGGICYGPGAPTINVNDAEVLEKWYAMWWKKASETWNFEFFKIDGQQDVVACYRASVDGGGVAGYRKGLAIARRIVGPEKFINACTGPILDAVGCVDGSRTGGDTGGERIAIGSILGSLYLNNVVWYSDPDAAANLYAVPVERARANAVTRALSGQQFLTDDLWTRVPPEICRVWQCSFPSLDIYPVNLYGMGGDHDLFDLRIAKPWGTWDVVAVCNYSSLPAEKILDLARLPLEAKRVHVLDYWDSRYVGRFAADAKLPVSLRGVDARVFAVVPGDDDRPALLSTSRHVSQGGLDLERVDWKRDGTKCVASGQSSHLVRGDPYALTFFRGRYQVATVEAAGHKTSLRPAGRLARAIIEPAASGTAEWQVTFEPAAGPMLEITPAAITLGNVPVELTVQNLGDQPARWTAAASDPHFRMSAEQGTLRPGETARIALSLDPHGLKLGAVLPGTLSLLVENQPVDQVIVTGRMPPPEDLARKATATASSSWYAQSLPDLVNDGDPETYWSGGRSSDGWWLELTWPRAFTFNEIVVREKEPFAGRVKSWKLLAGDEALAEIASGQAIGCQRVVTLAKPVHARRLRFQFGKAGEPPTITEVVVQNTSAEAGK